MLKRVFEGGETSGKLRGMILLPLPEQILEFPKRTLVGHDQEQLALQVLLRVLLIFESVLGCNVLDLELSKPLQAVSLLNGINEVLDRPNGLEHQGLFGL